MNTPTFATIAGAAPHGVWGALGTMLGIVFIDVVLAGDNAVLIALAVRQLQPQARWAGISIGTAIAVVLRVALTFVAMQILALPWLKFVGGALILWIAIKLLRDNTADEDDADKAANTLWQAIVLIVVADLTMSLDNVLAVAGAAEGHFWLLVFGLLVSIPLVIFSSNFLARLMDQFPATIYIGAAVLGWVAGNMIATDPRVERLLPDGPWPHRAIETLGTLLVVLSPLLLRSPVGRSESK